jgi:hypothetical protein
MYKCVNLALFFPSSSRRAALEFALKNEIKAEHLGDLGFEIDIEALAGCTPARCAPVGD